MILKEHEIKYIFNPSVLLPGDILLMNTYEERLRKMMKCKYEHAAIYLGDAYIMEANGLYVKMTHLYSYAFKELEHAIVLRLKDLSPIKMDRITRASHYQMGKQYVHTSMFRHVREFKNTKEQDTSKRSFCSRLLAQSYALEGVKIVPNADYCEPDDFLESSLLECVKNAIIPFSSEMTKVVMCQQKAREEYEADSPNAELFTELSKLYGTDIQELGQVFLASFSQKEKSKHAIDIIRASRMFKHLEDVNKSMPWFWKNEDFFAHYKNTEEELHFLYSQMNHYDNTFIPRYKELFLQMLVLAYYFPKNSLLNFMQEHIKKMVDDAIKCRKRMAELFFATCQHDKEGFWMFVDKYGFYIDVECVEAPIDIGFLFDDVMKALSELENK